MTRDEAIGHMEDGGIVTHRHFTSEEWVKITGDLYEFEDGCLCEASEFWLYRDEPCWLTGWREYQAVSH